MTTTTTPRPASRPGYLRRAATLRGQIRRTTDEAERVALRKRLLLALYTPWKRGQR